MSLKIKQLTYVCVALISLFIIFFIGVRFDAQTQSSNYFVTTNITEALKGFKKGLDIAGGVKLTYKIDLSKYVQNYPDGFEYAQVTKNVKDIILKNIDSRVSSLGVSDYNGYIQSLSDGDYVVVELWWVSDIDEAKNIIGKTVELDFKIPYESWENIDDIIISRKQLAEDLLVQTQSNPELFATLGQSLQDQSVLYFKQEWLTLEELPIVYQSNSSLYTNRAIWSIASQLTEGIYRNNVWSMSWTIEWRTISKVNAINTIPWSWDVSPVITYDIEDIVISKTPERILAKDPKTNSLLDGWFFKMASVSTSQLWQPVVVIQFDDVGKEIFCNLTESIVGKPMAIFIGGQLVTAPVIREKICWGSAQIDGWFTPQSAKALADELNTWALPAPLILAQEEKLSPLLWEQVLQGAMRTALIGIIAIFLYFYLMYGFKQALTALLTIILYILIIWAFVKMIGYALSMSGFAWLILSIGMAVDANILLYERLAEEVKNKNSISTVDIEQASSRSGQAIKDGNLTTMFIAILLAMMGVNVFKWYGTMMVITQLVTIIMVIPFTRDLLHTFYNTK